MNYNYILIYYFIVILSCMTSTLCSKENNGTLRIELMRQKTPREQYMNAPNLKEYGLDFDWLKGGNRTNDSIAIYRYLDNEFYGKIVIGHPGQTLNVAFDTAWSLSWVLSSKCNTWKTWGCWFHSRYDHSKSSEWKKDNRPYIADEGTFNLTGFYSYDNISIAHSNVTTQSFVEMVTVPHSFMFNKIDGILGLGMKIDSYEPFFYKLLRQKKIKSPLFSIYLSRDRQSVRGGNVLLGFIDDKHVHKTVYPNKTVVPDKIVYLPVDAGQFWKFSMDKVMVVIDKYTNSTLCAKGCKAFVDTSSNTIVGPVEDIEFIHNKIGASNMFLDRYSVNCETINKLPKIDFVLGGKAFRLSGPEYIIKMSYLSFTLCLSAFVPTQTPGEKGLWSLGGTFLSEYYSIYNINDKLIGFVKAA